MASASFVTDLTEIATQAAEAAAGIAGVVSGYKQVELARDYYNLYREQREFYYTTFQTGVEAPLANEVAAIPIRALDYAGTAGAAYDPVTGPLGGESTDALGWWTRHAGAYNTPIDPHLLRTLDADLAKIKSDWTNYLFRFEEHFTDTQNDIRWKKRMMLHNFGIKQGTAIAGALDSSLGEYQEQIADFGNMLATYGNGAARYVGYKKGLADTADDFDAVGFDPPLPNAVPQVPFVSLGQIGL